MADALPIFFAFVDADQRYVFANRAYERFVGATRGDIVGRTVETVVGEAIYEKIRSHARAALAGSRRRFQLEVEAPDGERRSLDVFYEPEWTPEGRIAGFFMAAVDESARVRLEKRLREKSAAIRTLHRIGSHPSLTLDEKIDALLKLGCEQFGLDLGVFARVVDDSWSALNVCPESSTIARGDSFPLRDTLCGEAVDADGPVHYGAPGAGGPPEALRAYPGEPVAAYLGVRVVVGGETYGTLSFTRTRSPDMALGSQHRDLISLMAYWLGSEIDRQAVLRSQAFLAEAGRVLTASLDRGDIVERLVRLVLPALGEGCVMYELQADGTVRRTRAGHIDPETNARLAALPAGTVGKDAEGHPVLSALRTGEAVLRSSSGEGGPSWFRMDDSAWGGPASGEVASLLVVPIRARAGALGAMALFTAVPGYHSDLEVTIAGELAARCGAALDNAALLEESRLAVTARDELLSFVSHDLGSPLSSISMSAAYVMQLMEEEGGSEKVRSYLKGILEAAGRMEGLIEDLLEVRILDEGRGRAPEAQVEARALVEDAVRELGPRFEVGSVELDITTCAEASVRGDRHRLLRVLVNLLDNAAKFTEPGGRVEVGVERTGDGMVRFFVSDTGKGIPEERLDRVFDRYAHAHEEQRAGAGLGLAIVKKTVEGHGGRAWVESEPGVGSTFHFTLPEG